MTTYSSCERIKYTRRKRSFFYFRCFVHFHLRHVSDSFLDFVLDEKEMIFQNPMRLMAAHDSSFLFWLNFCCQYDSHWLPDVYLWPWCSEVKPLLLFGQFPSGGCLLSTFFIHRLLFYSPVWKRKMTFTTLW